MRVLFNSIWGTDNIATTNAPGSQLYDDIPANFGLRIERTGADMLALSYLVGDDVLLTSELKAGQSPLTYTFGEVSIGDHFPSFDYAIRIDNIVVTSNVPEPASMALLAAGGLLLLGRCRHASQKA